MRVLIATPTANGLVEVKMARSVAETMAALVRAGHTVAWADYESPLVDAARTHFAQECRRAEADGILFWDSDTAVGNPVAVSGLLQYDIATAAVVNRHVAGQYAIYRDSSERKLDPYHKGEFSCTEPFHVDGCGAALLWIKREVLDTIYTRGMWPPFKTTIHADGYVVGEDVGFCRLARSLGYSIMCDPRIATVHIGKSASEHSPLLGG